MADEYDGDTAVRHFPYAGKETIRLGFGEHRGRLVKHKQLEVVLVEFPRYLDKLHMPDREPVDHHEGIDIDAERQQRGARLRRDSFSIQGLIIFAGEIADDGGRQVFPVQLDIAGNRKAGQQHEFLMNHSNAKRHRLLGRINMDIRAVVLNSAFKASRIPDHSHSEEYVHQRRFARAILAHQSDDLARVN
jgi:hypothetical protein